MRRNVYLLGLASFFNDASSDGVYALLPLYLKDPALVGFVGGLFNGLAYMVKPFSGFLSDRTGKTKPFIVGGYLLSALARTTLALVPKSLVPISVVVDRIGKGLRDAPRDTLLAATREKGWAFSLHRALDTAGAVVGSLASLFFLGFLGVREAILVLALAGFLSLVPLFFVEDRRDEKKEVSFTSSVSLSVRQLGPAAVVAVLLGLSLISPALLIERAVEVFGEGGIGLYVLFNVIYVISAIALGKKSDEYGRERIVSLGLLAAAAGLLLVSLNHPLSVIVGFGLIGVAFGAGLPALFAWASDRVKTNIGTGMGVVQFLLGLSMLVSSVIAGIAVKAVGSPALALFSVPAVGALVYLRRGL